MIRVNFVMGYLGAGKTTFIQSFLNSSAGRKERILLIVNDFGKVNYDALSLGENAPEIEAITYGCLCCDLKIRFRQLLLECGDRNDLDRILIEPSGILIPDVIMDVFDDPSISKKLLLEPLVHIVDVSLFSKIYHKLPPFIVRQIALSEKIVLNRLNKVSADELQQVKGALININCEAEYFDFSDNESAWNILSKSSIVTGANAASEKDGLFDTHNYKSIQVTNDLEFEDRDELYKFLINQGINLERAKGIGKIEGAQFFVQYTKTEFSVLPWTKVTKHGISMIFKED
jgi:G3E family GTPase